MYGQEQPQYFQNNPYNQPPPPPQFQPQPQYQPSFGGQPGFGGQPAQGPTVITIDNNRSGTGTFCTVCNRDTPSYTKSAFGIGNVIWCVLCFACFGPFSLMFLCMDQFGDTDIKCAKRTTTKQSVSGGGGFEWLISHFQPTSNLNIMKPSFLKKEKPSRRPKLLKSS